MAAAIAAILGCSGVGLAAWADAQLETADARLPARPTLSKEAAEHAQALAQQAQSRSGRTPVSATPGVAVDVEHIRALSDAAKKRTEAAMRERVVADRTRSDHDRHGDAYRQDQTPVGTEPETLSGRLVVALSSSMPESMVREYLRQLDGLREGVVVLRGFIGGARKVAPTGIWIEDMRRAQADCQRCPHRAVQVLVDPLTYQMLGIEKVPAVTYVPGIQDLKHCDAEQLKAEAIVYGAVSLAAAVRQLQHEGVEVPPHVLTQLERRT